MSSPRHDEKDQPVYSMGVVERLTGLTGRRIRYYEQMGLVSPARSPGNQRLYSERDVERLKQIGRLMDRRLTTRRVRRLLEDQAGPGERPLSVATSSTTQWG
ncbi:MAG: MerR family transcriptional regulator [Bacillota bacterium]|nr:MerR family transcriptional regulator [Bacillota bacterium]